MKLFIFTISKGYGYEEYYPIVAENEDKARQVLYDSMIASLKFMSESYDYNWLKNIYKTHRYPNSKYANMDEEVYDYYIKTYSLDKDEKYQIENSQPLSVDLPLTVGFVKELFHDFIE